MTAQANPFQRRTIVIMVIIGFAAFISLLFALGANDPSGGGKNGAAHAASNSLVGYVGLAHLLEKTGTPVTYSRNAAGKNFEGLLVVTPDIFADGAALKQLTDDRSYVGPTLIILPKWSVAPGRKLKKGWVERVGPLGPELLAEMLSDISEVKLKRGNDTGGGRRVASAVGDQVRLPPQPTTVSGDYMRTIIGDAASGEALVAYLDDGGQYAQLDALDESRISKEEDIDPDLFPVVIVADADLLNNGGLADKENARNALALFKAASTGSENKVSFDLTFNGLGRTDNLLTHAFAPPFLSATICLIVAALAAAWMAFNRFGPALLERRSIDFGKAALVHNSADFIQHMGRSHLVTIAYAKAIRRAAIRALNLPATMSDSDIDRELDALGATEQGYFSSLFHALTHAQKAYEIAAAAAALHLWKKEKIG